MSEWNDDEYDDDEADDETAAGWTRSERERIDLANALIADGIISHRRAVEDALGRDDGANLLTYHVAIAGWVDEEGYHHVTIHTPRPTPPRYILRGLIEEALDNL